ncbi:MAG: fibronectin type III domain-containing protein [Eubacterium sp.]|nr:fibronectin type III domain-containing protein [Eubacterium sp.]
MKTANKVLSVFLSLVMLVSIFSAIPVSAKAASLPKTSISSIIAYPSGFKVNVKKQSKITGYSIQYSTASNFKKANSVKTTSTSLTLRKLSSSKKYYVRVRTYKKSGKKYTYSAWSASKSIKTLNKNASDPAHIKSLKVGPASFTVTTYASKSATRFQVRYSTKKNFSGAKTKTSKTGTISVTGLAESTTYYVQTRTYKTVKGKNYYSNWSPSKTVKTNKKPVTTTKPVITAPTTSNQNIKDVFNLVNKERANNGVAKLNYRNDLQKAADTRAKEIATSFSHTRPNGKNWDSAITVSFKTAAENIAYGKNDASSVMAAWMSSAGHKVNILNKNFTGMAVGCYEKDGTKYWVQLFVG